MIYKLTGKLGFTCYTEVEADSLKEAIEIGFDRQVDENGINFPSSVGDEWHFCADGYPEDIKEEE